MNCGAKLPVFVLLAAAFFAENEAMIMVIITLIAWLWLFFKLVLFWCEPPGALVRLWRGPACRGDVKRREKAKI